MMFTKNTHGFTLIELLIVVAIIAILAAIAVPNFLEAQTRSKVSRAASDLRTMATGLEAYFVDNNDYPYAQSLTGQPWLAPGGMPFLNNAGDKVGGLTSPVAYLSSLPDDSFKHPIGSGINITAPLYYEKAGFGYMNGMRTSMTVNVPAEAVGEYNNLYGTGPDTPVAQVADTPQRWVLYSIGPDLDFRLKEFPSGTVITNSRYNLNNRYDPTNGTISGGNVMRFPGGRTYPGINN